MWDSRPSMPRANQIFSSRFVLQPSHGWQYCGRRALENGSSSKESRKKSFMTFLLRKSMKSQAFWNNFWPKISFRTFYENEISNTYVLKIQDCEVWNVYGYEISENAQNVQTDPLSFHAKCIKNKMRNTNHRALSHHLKALKNKTITRRQNRFNCSRNEMRNTEPSTSFRSCKTLVQSTCDQTKCILKPFLIVVIK